MLAQWKAEAAQIAARYGIDLDRVPRAYLWNLFADHVPAYEAARLCRNVIDAQEGVPSHAPK